MKPALIRLLNSTVAKIVANQKSHDASLDTDPREAFLNAELAGKIYRRSPLVYMTDINPVESSSSLGQRMNANLFSRRMNAQLNATRIITARSMSDEICRDLLARISGNAAREEVTDLDAAEKFLNSSNCTLVAAGTEIALHLTGSSFPTAAVSLLRGAYKAVIHDLELPAGQLLCFRKCGLHTVFVPVHSTGEHSSVYSSYDNEVPPGKYRPTILEIRRPRKPTWRFLDQE